MTHGPRADGRQRSLEAGLDAALVTLVSIAVAVPWLFRIGFYSDDWNFLQTMAHSPDPSLAGRFAALHDEWTAMRPVQLALLVVLYRLFGLDPTGYQLAITGLLVASFILLFSLQRALGADRAVALGAALVYATLPHFSADRFWMATGQISLSAATCFLSLRFELGAVTAPSTAGRGLRKLGALLAMAVSILAYEVFIPFFLLVPVLAVLQHRRAGSGTRRALWTGQAITLGTFAALLAFKAMTTVRAESAPFTHQLGWYADTLADIAALGFGPLGFALPWTALGVATRTGPLVLIVAAALAIVVFIGGARAGEDGLRPRALVLTAAARTAVFLHGTAIFLTNRNINVTATGIGNRVSLAWSAGIALVLVAAAGGLAHLLPRARRHVFAGLIALLAGSGTVLHGYTAGYWIEAYGEEQRIMEQLREPLATLPDSATLILDGICPYRGPAIVFESAWDIVGAASILSGHRTLRADVVTPRLTVEDDAVVTDIYGFIERYPYDRLFFFDARTSALTRVQDAAGARAYLAGRPDPDCPPGQPGYGTAILTRP